MHHTIGGGGSVQLSGLYSHSGRQAAYVGSRASLLPCGERLLAASGDEYAIRND